MFIYEGMDKHSCGLCIQWNIIQPLKGRKFWLKCVNFENIKPITKRQILYISIYTRYLEWSNTQRQEVEVWFPGSSEGNGKLLFKEYEIAGFFKMKRVPEMDGNDACTAM